MVSKMRFNFSHLLLLILVVFGSFYLFEPNYKDLWANLFATLIAVILIDRIVDKLKLQKSERSIRYIKGVTARIYANLMLRMRPPENWRGLLDKKSFDWSAYCNRIWTSRKEALDKLETLLDRHSHLMEAELRNDIFDMISLLEATLWFLTEQDEVPTADLFQLVHIATLPVAAIDESLKSLKRHKLLRHTGLSMGWTKGEPPRIQRGLPSPMGPPARYKNYEKWLNESIEFRDKLDRLARASMKVGEHENTEHAGKKE